MVEGKLVGNLFSDFFFRCINDVYRWNMRRLGESLNKICIFFLEIDLLYLDI